MNDRGPMNDWWFRLVHAHTQRHQRNMYLVDQIINSTPNSRLGYNPPSSRFEYAKGIMRGCGCNVLA